MPLCSWCRQRRVERRGALYCSHACRQAAYLARHAELALLGQLVAVSASLNRAAEGLRQLTRERHAREHRTRKGGAE